MESRWRVQDWWKGGLDNNTSPWLASAIWECLPHQAEKLPKRGLSP
jgi:hypothetical protein